MRLEGAQGLESPAKEPSLSPAGTGEPWKISEQGSESQVSVPESPQAAVRRGQCLPWATPRSFQHISEQNKGPSPH